MTRKPTETLARAGSQRCKKLCFSRLVLSILLSFVLVAFLHFFWRFFILCLFLSLRFFPLVGVLLGPLCLFRLVMLSLG